MEDKEDNSFTQLGGKKKNGHKANCKCPICINMKHANKSKYIKNKKHNKRGGTRRKRKGGAEKDEDSSSDEEEKEESDEEMEDELEDELEDEPEEMVEEAELRAVDLSAPAFMRASAKRGLALHEQGLSGDGLMPQTVEDARNMAAGQVTEAKWRKIGAWIARHIDDLDAVQGDEITAGLVAMLLWGGGSSKASARRAQEYANRVVERLDSE